MKPNPYPVGPRFAADGVVAVAAAAVLGGLQGFEGSVYAVGAMTLAAVGAWPERAAFRESQANRVTLFRAVLMGWAASWLGDTPPWFVVAAAALALALDGVDGWVARKTRTETPFGGRLDMEVDAVFTVVLCLLVYLDGKAGVWVLAGGALRYIWVLAGTGLSWLSDPLDDRFARKVCCAVEVGALIAALALPASLAGPVCAVALLALVHSFTRDAWYLYRQAH